MLEILWLNAAGRFNRLNWAMSIAGLAQFPTLLILKPHVFLTVQNELSVGVKLDIPFHIMPLKTS